MTACTASSIASPRNRTPCAGSRRRTRRKRRVCFGGVTTYTLSPRVTTRTKRRGTPRKERDRSTSRARSSATRAPGGADASANAGRGAARGGGMSEKGALSHMRDAVIEGLRSAGEDDPHWRTAVFGVDVEQLLAAYRASRARRARTRRKRDGAREEVVEKEGEGDYLLMRALAESQEEKKTQEESAWNDGMKKEVFLAIMWRLEQE